MVTHSILSKSSICGCVVIRGKFLLWTIIPLRVVATYLSVYYGDVIFTGQVTTYLMNSSRSIDQSFNFSAKRQMAFRHYAISSASCLSPSSITNWAACISQERFDLDSPNFTWTSILASSTTPPDMTSFAVSVGKLPRKNGRKCRLRGQLVRNSQERLMPRSQHYPGQLAPQIRRL